MKLSKFQDMIRGGAGDGKTIEDIVEKYAPKDASGSKIADMMKHVRQQLKDGIKMEKEEHSKGNDYSTAIATEIAMDHLYKEGINYYVELKKMEKKLEK